MSQLPGHATQWLTVLSISIILSILGTTLPNKFRQAAMLIARSHNGIKLFNECLARHQLAYFTYFFAIWISADFGPAQELMKYLIGLFVAITVFLFVEAVYHATVIQDRLIASSHVCPIDGCPVNMSFSVRFRVCRWNLFSSLILLSIGIWVAMKTR